MVKRILLTIFGALPAFIFSLGQETDYGFDYQTIMIDNPAFAGSESDGIMRLSYMNHYPGKNFNLQSFFFSYDAFFPGLHGGLGAYVSNDYIGGIVNDLRGGFSYSYHLQADRNFFIDAGLGASFFHRGININNVILPDQIDPLNGYSQPSGEILSIRGRTVFDISTGVVIIAGRFFAGFSINHLAQPGLTSDGSDIERLLRKYSINAAGRFNLDRNQDLVLIPVILAEAQGDRISAGAGAAFEAGLLSLSSVFSTNNNQSMNIRTGFSVKKGVIKLIYNYTFNILSENSRQPFSLMHQAGLAVSLNNVDKRKIFKTINFPNL